MNDDLTGGKRVNPFHDENKVMSLVTPDRSGEQALGNTGNTDGLPDTGGNTTVTLILAQNRDDFTYLADDFEPNKNSVGKMGEFLKQPDFGNTVKGNTQKTDQQCQGQSICKATDNIGDYIKKDDQFYLGGLHKDHIEIFDKRGNFRAVLNLDGSVNERKTQQAEAEGRKIK
ncbi:hypothetical protein [Duffyella gerundensis]|uniref:hypothetical protein n=1 Tax=Duffyella gerundensis TaxID=1619313 RepID=UPI001CE27186|nr:hypothetical protein [Duffyella gerundensis]